MTSDLTEDKRIPDILRPFMKSDDGSFADRYSRIKNIVFALPQQSRESYLKAIAKLYESDPYAALGFTQYFPGEISGLEKNVLEQLEEEGLRRSISIFICRDRKIKKAKEKLEKMYYEETGDKTKILLALMAISPEENFERLKNCLKNVEEHDKIFLVSNVLYDLEPSKREMYLPKLQEMVGEDILNKSLKILKCIQDSS